MVRMYVRSNKESDPEKYALKLKMHHGGVRRCQYTQDGTRVVSCSTEGDVKACTVHSYSARVIHLASSPGLPRPPQT